MMKQHTHPELVEAITAVSDRVSGIDRRISVFQEGVTLNFEDIRRRLENDIPHAQRNTKKIALAGPVLIVLGYGARFLLQLLGLPIP